MWTRNETLTGYHFFALVSSVPIKVLSAHRGQTSKALSSYDLLRFHLPVIRKVGEDVLNN